MPKATKTLKGKSQSLQKLTLDELQKKYKYDKSKIKGTGVNSRILKKDIIDYVLENKLEAIEGKKSTKQTEKINKRRKETKVRVLTIFDEITSNSKDFHKGFMFPTKTFISTNIEDLQNQFSEYLTNYDHKNNLLTGEALTERIKDSVKNLKNINPHLESAYITTYSEAVFRL